MKTLTVLKKARRLISDPSKWTKGTSARDAEGMTIDYNDPNAVSFCAVGAIWACEKGDSPEEAPYLVRVFVPGNNIPYYNDHPKTTHDDVLTVYDWAIGTLEAGVEL